MDEYQKLKFNVLFKDIYKFYNKSFNLTKTFDDFSKDFIEKYYSNLEFDENLNKIIQNTELYSDFDYSNELLDSIFSKISIEGNKTTNYAVPLTKLELNDTLYPTKDINNYDYSGLWQEFVSEFDLINDYLDFNTILALVKKYTSTICYSEDVSLFNHIKTTIALTNCLYINDEVKSNPFLIINGDISGIQKFIYRVSSPIEAQKGMSKRLRGRSLYLTLITESICNKFISKLNLDSTNILFCGGGRFTIIAPNIEKTHEIISEIDFEVNKEFIDKFNAELYLVLVSQESSINDLKDFSNILSKLNSSLSENKKHKFSNHLSQLFEVKKSTKNNLCVVCGNDTDNEEFCKECESHSDLGKDVANAKYLIVFESEMKSKYHIFGVNYIFEKSKKKVMDFINKNPDEHLIVYKINDTNFLDLNNSNNNVSFDFKFIGNNVPNIDGIPLYFEHLAQLSKGASKLGVLKMDVDNLGKIFSEGFNHEKNESNIYKISSLSFYLDLFFSGMINNIIDDFKVYSYCGDYRNYFEKDVVTLKFENEDKFVYVPKKGCDIPDELERYATSTIYINYSGGDDLLVLGPYDDIIKFALKFRNKFKQWTCCNYSINISAGISLFSSKFPIGKAAIIADEMLEQSKDCGRDKITLFNQTLSWDDNGQIVGFNRLFEFACKLENLTSQGILSNSFTYSLMKLWESNNNIGELTHFSDKDWCNYNRLKSDSREYVPKYYYKLRLVKKEYRDNLAEDFKFIPWIKVPVSWVSLRLRG